MKHCATCQTTYTDNTLRFCLKDGTQLSQIADENSASLPTTALDEYETVVSRKPPQQVVLINAPETQPENQERVAPPRIEEQPRIVAPPIERKDTNTTKTVLATVLGMLAIFGIIGAGAWFLLKSRRTEITAVNTAPVNRPPVLNASNIQTSNANNVKPTVTPTATPIPKPTISSEAAKAVTDDVKNTIDDWKSSSENLDIDGNLERYADSVDYYRAGRVNRAAVRADKQRAFERFDTINFNVSNVKVTPNASGDKATAVFDKEWTFEGEDRRSAGKVQQQLTLAKIGERWLITGERDLKVYYIEK